MCNLQRMKIMKRILIASLAFFGIFAVSCNKEMEAPVAPAENAVAVHKQTIIATIGSETRTAYADFQKFSWKAGDKVDILTYNESTEYARIATFTAQEDGKTTVFEGDVEDGYTLVDLAVYPDRAGYIQDDLAVYLPSAFFVDSTEEDYYTVSSDNPLENLALVGRLNDDKDAYAFKTAMGAVKITLTDLSSEARFLRIYAPEKISGYFFIDDNDCLSNESAVPGTFTTSDGSTQNYSGNNIWYHFTPAADGSVTLYIPLPVGKLSAGTKIFVEDEDENVLFEKKVKKDIVVERNKVTELVPLSTKIEWVSLGTGKFGDHYHYKPEYDVDVEIQQNPDEPTQFRLVDPYAGYREITEYQPTGEEYGPDPYLYFRIISKGETVNGVTAQHDDLVYFDACYTGIIDDNYGVDPFLAHPSRWGTTFSESQWLRSIVVKYQSDGVTPSNIQLAPVFFWLTEPDEGTGYWSGENALNDNNVIEIRFPGAERVDLQVSVEYVEIADSDPAQAIALVSYEASDAIQSAKLVIAANEADAKAALADASRYTEVTVSDTYEVKLPANAPSGDYYVYAQTTVSPSLTPVSAQLLASESFKYFNADTNLDYKLEDIVGSYSVKQYHYNAQEGDWILGEMTFNVEESDDPLFGDIMFTEFLPETIGYFSNLTYISNLYASFNTATGEITIPGGQTIATSGGAEWIVGEFSSSTADVHMILTKAGVLQIDGNVVFYPVVDGENLGRFMWTNENITFTRTASHSAPALAPARGRRGANEVSAAKLPGYASRTHTARALVPVK